jgi:hypothetical protein
MSDGGDNNFEGRRGSSSVGNTRYERVWRIFDVVTEVVGGMQRKVASLFWGACGDIENAGVSEVG